MSSAAILSSLPLPFHVVHLTMPQHSTAMYINTAVGGQGSDRAGFDGVGGVMGLGLAG